MVERGVRFVAIFALFGAAAFFLKASLGGSSASATSLSKKSTADLALASASQSKDGIFGRVSLSGPVPKLAVDKKSGRNPKTHQKSPFLAINNRTTVQP